MTIDGSCKIIVEDLGDRVVARLNRPQVRNAIDADLVDELHVVCAALEREPRVLLITGQDGNFCAGADVAQLRSRGRNEALQGITSAVFERVQRLPQPVIALLDGYAFGGGAELAYAADFRIATPRVKIGNPEPGLGIIAGAGATWRLRELMGEPLAKEILLLGRVLDAEEALAARLITERVEVDDLESAGHRMADRLIRLGPLAVRLTKAVFHASRSAHPLIDNIAQAVLFETEDKQERMERFLQRPKGGER